MTTYRDLFRRHGLRCTEQRERLFSALADTTAHPTAEELHALVCDNDAELSLATVYNTLEAFTRVGLCRRITGVSPGSPCRYDANTADHIHVSTPDGRLLDVPHELGTRLLQSLPADLIERVQREMGVRIDRVNIALFATGESQASTAAAAGASASDPPSAAGRSAPGAGEDDPEPVDSPCARGECACARANRAARSAV